MIMRNCGRVRSPRRILGRFGQPESRPPRQKILPWALGLIGALDIVIQIKLLGVLMITLAVIKASSLLSSSTLRALSLGCRAVFYCVWHEANA